MTRMAASGTMSRRRRSTAAAQARASRRSIISPFAKRGFVDHTLYDTTSILKLIETRLTCSH